MTCSKHFPPNKTLKTNGVNLGNLVEGHGGSHFIHSCCHSDSWNFVFYEPKGGLGNHCRCRVLIIDASNNQVINSLICVYVP